MYIGHYLPQERRSMYLGFRSFLVLSINVKEWKKWEEIIMERKDAWYIRESTKKQVLEGFNFDMQLKKIQQFTEIYDYTDEHEVYRESGYSAKTTNRPELNRLKADIRKGEIKRLIVYKMDRLVRRHAGYEEIRKLCDEYNVALVSVFEMFDTATPQGCYALNMLISAAEYEQDILSQRTNDGLTEGAEQGYYMIGGQKPFGWSRYKVGEHKKICVNEQERKVIHKMAALLKAGYSMFQIRMIVNDDEYMKSINKTFCENQITNILKSKLNMGIFEYKGKEYTIEGETIFTEEEYAQIQRDLSERSKEGKYDYLFYRKVRNKNGEMAKVKCTVKKNAVYLYHYDIQTKKRINEKDIKDQVVSYLKSSNLLYKQKRNRTHNADVRHMTARRNQLKKLHENMDLTTDIYLKEMKKLDKEQKQIDNCYKKYVQNFDTWFNSLSFDRQSKLIWQTIKYIEVDFETKDLIIYS